MSESLHRWRVLVVGCGWVSGLWLQALTCHDDVEIVGFVDPDAGAATTRAAQVGGGVVHSTIEEALLRDQPDIVVNLTPAECHVEITLAALRAGAHVFTEKPLASGIDGAREIVRVARAVDRRVSVMQNRRYEPGFRAFQEEVRKRNPPLLISCDVYRPWTFGGYCERIPSPLLADMAIHTFDQAHLLAGAAPAWVNCHELSLAGSWLAGSATAVATVTFRNGSVLDYRGSIAAWGCTTSWNGSWRVEGDGLSATWNGIGAAVATTRPFDEVGRPSGDTRVSVDLEVAERGDGHALCLAEMLSALKAGVPSPTDAEEVIYGVAMVDAARTSASENRRVDVSGMDLP